MRLSFFVLLCALALPLPVLAQSASGIESNVDTSGNGQYKNSTPGYEAPPAPTGSLFVPPRQAQGQQQSMTAQPGTSPGTALTPSVSTAAPVAPTLPAAIRNREAQQAAKPRVSNPWARAAALGGNTALYMTLTGGQQDDKLLRVTTPWAEKAELHETVIDAEGVAKMQAMAEGLALAARQPQAFSPRGRHVMILGLKRELRAGQAFPVSLIFEKAGAVRVMVRVQAASGAHTGSSLQ